VHDCGAAVLPKKKKKIQNGLVDVDVGGDAVTIVERDAGEKTNVAWNCCLDSPR
jgi:hypothetical protein